MTDFYQGPMSCGDPISACHTCRTFCFRTRNLSAFNKSGDLKFAGKKSRFSESVRQASKKIALVSDSSLSFTILHSFPEAVKILIYPQV